MNRPLRCWPIRPRAGAVGAGRFPPGRRTLTIEDGITKSLETSIAIVKWLLAAGADPTLADDRGSTSPLESAQRNGPYAIFQLYDAAVTQSD